jgi:hypothetical protein
MRIDTPNLQPPASGDYQARISKGYGDPRGRIFLDEQRGTELENVRLEDCDRLIKAAAEIKAGILAYRAEMAAPHGRKHVHEGTCQLCGKPEDDALHADPEPVITDSDRTCDQANPDSGAWCHRSGDHGVHRDTNGEEWRTDAPAQVEFTSDSRRTTARCQQPGQHSRQLAGAVVDCDRPEHHEAASVAS